MRVLHAPANIANQPWGMAQGLRALGHEVEVWQYGASPFGYTVDRTIDTPTDPLGYLDLLVEAARAEFDVVHFHFAQTLVPPRVGLPWHWDLPVWRALGTRIVFTFHGSDVRLRSHHLRTDEWSFYRHSDTPCNEERIGLEMPVLRAYADVMTVGSTLDLPYVPGAVVVPKVIELDRFAMVGPTRSERPVVAHAPSRRSTKGTEFILEGFETLRQRGADFEVDLIEGVSHAEAMSRMSAADIVVEKVLGGDVGVTSLEAMAFGKVAVARIRPEVRAHVPDVPVVSADPTTFVAVMEDLLSSPSTRAELGRRGREFVASNHDAPVVARTLEQLYSGPSRPPPMVPPGWTSPDAEAVMRATQTRLAELEKLNRVLRRRAREDPKLLVALARRLRQRRRP